MMRFVPLVLVCILFPAIRATQLTKCEVYRAVEDMDGYEGISALECELFTLPLASSGSSPLSPKATLFPSPLLSLSHLLVVFSLFSLSSGSLLFRMFSCHSFLPLSEGSHLIKILCASLLLETGREVFLFSRESGPSITLLLQIFAKHLSSLSLRDLRYISQQWL